jgi:hypothetical protein
LLKNRINKEKKGEIKGRLESMSRKGDNKGGLKKGVIIIKY